MPNEQFLHSELTGEIIGCAMEVQKETLKVSFVNLGHVSPESLGKRGAIQPGKPLGSS
jgi:hypothetical protein